MARPVLSILLLLSVLLLGWDLTRLPESQWSAKTIVGAIDVYQATVSRALGAAGARCRFEPTCSHYGRSVLQAHGTLRGSGLALRRIARCGPWTPANTVDPPPLLEERPKNRPEEGPEGRLEAVPEP